MNTSELDRQIVAALTRHYIGSPARLMRLVDVQNRKTVTYWLSGASRPNRTALTRMCRLVMWGASRWPEEARVEWSAMRMWPPTMPDPFKLSERVRFGYGGQRDGGALIRDAMARLGIEQTAHLGRQLELPDKMAYKYMYRWRNGLYKASSRYLIRLLALLLWDTVGFPVLDMWAVNWTSRTVEWSWDGHSGAPVPLQGNPFEWLAITGQRVSLPPLRRLHVEPLPIPKEKYVYA